MELTICYCCQCYAYILQRVHKKYVCIYCKEIIKDYEKRNPRATGDMEFFKYYCKDKEWDSPTQDPMTKLLQMPTQSDQLL